MCNSNDGWFAGIDAGGTATKAFLYHPATGVTAQGVAGPGNVFSQGEQGLIDAVRDALHEAAREAQLQAVPSFVALVAGVAGIRPDRPAGTVQLALERSFVASRLEVVSDLRVALASATFGRPGTVVIAGTGSSAWALGRNASSCFTGGWGYLVGDEGSGFWTGLQGLRSVVRAADGRDGPTSLARVLIEGLGLPSADALTDFLYASALPKQQIASLAPLVVGEAQRGDAAARRIVDEAVRELALAAQVAHDGAGLTANDPVVASGGLFAERWFFDRFADDVSQLLADVAVVRPRLSPAAGACGLALRLAERLGEHEKEALIKSTHDDTSGGALHG